MKVTEEKATVGDGSNGSDLRLQPSSRSGRKTPLTRTLESARASKTGKVEKTQRLSESQPLLDLGSGTEDAAKLTNQRRSSKSHKSNHDAMQELIPDNDFDGDMTMDLNLPHSQSGKYWKTEYEHYHEEANAEMKKLLKYKQLAKSYAKKKDAEALELAEQLKLEQRRIVNMEEEISRLSAQLTSTCIDGKDDDSPEPIKELERHPALAVQYRAEVEEFRAAFEGNGELANGTGEKRLASPRTAQILLGTHHELRKAREQLIELNDLRQEMNHLRQTLSTAEKNNHKLRDENTKLAKDLLHADYRFERQMEKSGKRRSSSEDLVRRKDEAFRALQKDYDTLKEQAKSQRREAEKLLRNRHDQAVVLRKEVASLKGGETNVKDLQAALTRKDLECNKVIAGYLKQIEQLKSPSAQKVDLDLDQKDVKFEEREHRRQGEQRRGHNVPGDGSCPRDSSIPIPSPSLSRPSRSMAPSQHSRSDTPIETPALKHRSSQLALSEIHNNASSEHLVFRKSDLVHVTPLADRFSSMPQEEPELQLHLPSPEPSLPHVPSRAIYDKNFPISPRSSMFNIASSPPKPVMIRSRDAEPSKQHPNGDISGKRQKHVASTQHSDLESSRPRGDMPPERAAAAKARLEKKNAEKKRAKAWGADKENIPG